MGKIRLNIGKIKVLFRLTLKKPAQASNPSLTISDANTSLSDSSQILPSIHGTIQNNNNNFDPRCATSLLPKACLTTSQTSPTLTSNPLSSSAMPLSNISKEIITITDTCTPTTTSKELLAELPSPNPISLCSHVPQCVLRNSFPPPQQQNSPPPKPQNIGILPLETLSYQQYWDLISTHECEECEPGMLFHKYVEKVKYDDPEANGEVIRTALYACPNNPKATILVEKENKSELKKLEFNCCVCGKSFSSLEILEFHKRRNH